MKLLPRWFSEHLKVKAGMFLLAVLLWFLVVSEKNYDYILDIPIIPLGLPKDHVLLNPIPASAKVKFHGRGRELLRLIYVNQPHLKLDLTKPPGNGIVRLRTDMVLIPGGLLVNVPDIVTPDSILVRFDDIQSISTPVIPALKLTLEPGYSIVGAPMIDPPQITLTGPEKSLRGVKSVMTEQYSKSNLKQSIEIPLSIVLPNGFGIEASAKTVTATIKVERLGERVLDGVQLTIHSAPNGKRLEIEPKSVKVQLNGPVSTLSELQLENLTAWVDWEEYNTEKPGWLPVHVESEPGVEVKVITPSRVRAVLRKQ